MPFEDPPSPRAPRPTPPEKSPFWRDLLHLWFVKYNPLYLVSAMLVLAGLNLVSKGLASEGSLYGPLAVGLVAEVYAAVLIGGAALLTRVGQRRPAVLLALIAIVYQVDLTLHTETCAVLGALGVTLSALWLAIFVAKLVALGWALRVRIAPRALLAATLGALGLAALPRTFVALGPEHAGTLLALFVFALGVVFPRDLTDCVTSRAELDAWGRLVLRRTVLATWAIWGVLFALHVAFWASEAPIAWARVVLALLALVVARQPRELRVWVTGGGALALFAVTRPSELSSVAALFALTLAVRAATRLRTVVPALRSTPDDPSPYRVRTTEREAWTTTEALARVSPEERLRLITGTLAATYVAQWTSGWRGGSLPPHNLLVDVLFLAVAAVVAWRARGRLVLGFAGLVVGHGVAVSGVLALVPRPHSLVGWGASALVLGFALLLAAIGVSFAVPRRLARPAEGGEDDRGGHDRAPDPAGYRS